jgi:hypothetical protein
MELWSCAFVCAVFINPSHVTTHAQSAQIYLTSVHVLCAHIVQRTSERIRAYCEEKKFEILLLDYKTLKK